MSVYHRVDNIYAMPAARFFRFAERLPYYEGATQWAMRQALKDKEDAPQATPESLVSAEGAGMLPTMPGMPPVFDFAVA